MTKRKGENEMTRMKKRVLALMCAGALVFSGCSAVTDAVREAAMDNIQDAVELPSDEEIETSELPSTGLSADWDKPSETEDVVPGLDMSQFEEEDPEYEDDFDDHNPNEWQKAYKEFLDDQNDIVAKDPDQLTVCQYFLADVDDTYGSFIPELCIKTGTCEADYMLLIYTYDEKKGEVINLVPADTIYAGHQTFLVAPNGNLCGYGGHMGYLFVNEYSDLSGKVQCEVIYEQNINGDENAEYATVKDIFGEDIPYCVMAPATNPALLLWYLNMPVATGIMDDDKQVAAVFDMFMDASGKKQVYAVGCDEYVDSVKGLVTLEELLNGGTDLYSKEQYLYSEYCDADMNDDGQIERMLKIVNNKGTYSYILLSLQDGVCYAYVFPYLSLEGNLDICNFSVYHNWFNEGSESFYGFVFDKDKCVSMYSDTADKDSADAAKKQAKEWVKMY